MGLVFAAAFGVGTYFIVRASGDDKATTDSTVETPAGGPGSPTTLAPAGGGGDAQRGGVLTFALGVPDGIDPVNVWESEGVQVVQCVFDSLVTFDPETGEVLPAAAASWETNDDASAWTFHLVEGARFHDGSPVTAADFKYAWERICDPANDSRISYHLSAVKGYDAMLSGAADTLEGVQAPDDYTLRVTLSHPFADFALVAGHPALAPVPQVAVEEDPLAYAKMPIGNGPFKLAQPWAGEEVIDLVRFDDYYGTKAYLDGVEFQMFPYIDTAYSAFQNAELDFCPLPDGELEAASTAYGVSEDGITVSPGHQVLTGTEASIEYLFLNTRDAILSNVQLRRALSLAIDRQDISDTLNEGVSRPATSIVPEGLAGYVEGAWPYARYDVAAAEQALAGAGYPGGRNLPPIYFYLPAGSDYDMQVFDLVRADLAVIGVTLVAQEVDYTQYLRRLAAGDFMMGHAGWIADYPSIDNFLYPLFAAESADNQSLYDDPAFESAIAGARATTDDDERLARLQELVTSVGEATPVIPLLQGSHRSVGSARLRNFVFDRTGLAHLESAWLDLKSAPPIEGEGPV